MADLKTQRLTREQIAAIVGRNPRAIKLLEDLLQDVSETLPTSISDVEEVLRLFLQSDGSRSSATAAQALAAEVLTLLQTSRAQQTQIVNLRREVDELRALLLQSASSLTTVRQLRADIEELRAITLGA
jgi:hypothetical protein